MNRLLKIMKSFAGLKQKYIGDRAFYKRYLLLAVPMIVQNAITNLVSFLDNIMVGQLGTEQMSGVAIAVHGPGPLPGPAARHGAGGGRCAW